MDWNLENSSSRWCVLVETDRFATGRKRGNGIEGSITASYAITMISTWNVNDYNPTFHDSRSSSNRFAYRGVSTRMETRSFSLTAHYLPPFFAFRDWLWSRKLSSWNDILESGKTIGALFVRVRLVMSSTPSIIFEVILLHIWELLINY